jgi:aryl-alcohol dehydrogenase-like predicted oxidoreductase
MNYKQLTETDLLVSGLCLGTVQFGASVGEKECFEQLDEFTDLGGNFLDTAHVYGDWLPGERARSERVIGKWLKQSGRRNHFVISTKGAHPRLDSMGIPRVNRKAIMTDIEESLKCLDTDTIDLYFLHRDDENISVSEILDVLEKAKNKGYIRYYGCSNWKLERLEEAQRAAENQGLSGFICNQLMWSLADMNPAGLGDPTLVWMDQENYDYHKEKQLSAMAYMSVAKGYFSKLLKGDTIPENVAAIYENETNYKIAEELKALKACGITPVQACISYFNEQPFTAIPLASFRSIEQMKETVAGCDVTLSMEVRKRINNIKTFVSDL